MFIEVEHDLVRPLAHSYPRGDWIVELVKGRPDAGSSVSNSDRSLIHIILICLGWLCEPSALKTGSYGRFSMRKRLFRLANRQVNLTRLAESSVAIRTLDWVGNGIHSQLLESLTYLRQVTLVHHVHRPVLSYG